MADFPAIAEYSDQAISPSSPNALGGSFNCLNTTLAGGAVWPSANLAILYPFRIAQTYNCNQVWWGNGVTVTNNHVDVGVYDSQGNLLISAGSTLSSGASAIQVVNVTDTLLRKGLYYLGMAVDGVTDTPLRGASSSPANTLRTFGVMNVATSFPLPSTITLAGSTNAYLPLFGITLSSTL